MTPTRTTRILTYDEWADEFGTLSNPAHPEGDYFETYGPEWEIVNATAPERVWTMVDGDDGELYVLHGFHWVNRIYYMLTERPGDFAVDYDITVDGFTE